MANLIRQASGASRELQSSDDKKCSVERTRELANDVSDLTAGLLKQRLRDVLDY